MSTKLLDTILISGASGFIGKHFCDYLNRETVTYVKLNLRDYGWQESWKNSFQPIKTVVHLAGANEGTAGKTTYDEVNAILTKKVFESFLESNAELFIYVSSIKALADEEINEKPLTEDLQKRPSTTAYAQSKADAEKYISSVSLPSNKRLVIVRPCLVYGPGNLGNLNRLIKMVQNGIPYPFAALDNQRSILYVENFCAVLKALHEKTIDSGIYHLSDNGYYSTTELVEMIAKELGKPAKLWAINKKYLIFMAKLGSFFHLPFNLKTLHKLTKNYRVENSKLLNALEIKLPYSTKKGIQKTITSIK